MKNENNKFEIAHNDLKKFCRECKLNKKANCDMYDNKCEEYSKKLHEYYYTVLYPYHPCKDCVVEPMCRDYRN